MKIVLPKTLVNMQLADGPLFFLAGPVRGGNDWQRDCCKELQKHLLSFHAAIPCRYESGHDLLAYKMPGKEGYFDRQLTWERYYLERAATTGCIIFWLPCESTINPRGGHEPYAMDTRGELGEWRGRMMHDPSLRIVIGAEPRFPGLSQIQRNFDLALGMNFRIYSTLAHTVKAAVEKAR